MTEILNNPVIVDPLSVKVKSFESELAELAELPANQRSRSALVVTMLQDHVEVEIHAGLKKQISYGSFKEIINKSLNQVDVETAVITGFSPPSSVFFISQSANAMSLNCYYPGGNKPLIYGSRKMEFAAPNIIIGFTLKKDSSDWVIASANYFCTDLPVGKLPRTFINSVDHKKGIYLLPMTNTYGGGNMCYGGNSMPARFKDNNLRGLDWYYKYLWESPFNNDLGLQSINNKVDPGKWYEMLDKCAKRNDVFPYVDLAGYRALDGSIPSKSVIDLK